MAFQGFTAEEYQAALSETGTPDAAYAKLWRERAAEYSTLVDIEEGSSKRAMSQLYRNALQMAESYDSRVAEQAETARARRPSRTRKIVRP